MQYALNTNLVTLNPRTEKERPFVQRSDIFVTNKNVIYRSATRKMYKNIILTNIYIIIKVADQSNNVNHKKHGFI